MFPTEKSENVGRDDSGQLATMRDYLIINDIYVHIIIENIPSSSVWNVTAVSSPPPALVKAFTDRLYNE